MWHFLWARSWVDIPILEAYMITKAIAKTPNTLQTLITRRELPPRLLALRVQRARFHNVLFVLCDKTTASSASLQPVCIARWSLMTHTTCSASNVTQIVHKRSFQISTAVYWLDNSISTYGQLSTVSRYRDNKESDSDSDSEQSWSGWFMRGRLEIVWTLVARATFRLM